MLYLKKDTPNPPGLFSILRRALAKESLVGATALVRESDSHGDSAPHQDLSTVTTRRRQCPVFSLLSLLAYSLPHT